MRLHFTEKKTGGKLWLIKNEVDFQGSCFQANGGDNLTIAWNSGKAQAVHIDEMPMEFPPQTILPLVINQSFRFERPEDIVAWQFNRDFYCIVDHDAEVGCVGFLFYGLGDSLFIGLDRREQESFRLMLQVFIEEMNTEDNIQAEMLRALLKRLIIKITRQAKEQYLDGRLLTDDKLDTVRKYNLLVECNFRRAHEVQFYAAQLNKSPKTLSNLFALYNHHSPLKIIHNRLVLEAKRLFNYTDKSAKEVAFELGFEDAAHFSRFFKCHTGLAPSEFRHLLRTNH